jgi:hypothetical protein
MLHEKHQRLEAIKADEAEIAKIDATIARCVLVLQQPPPPPCKHAHQNKSTPKNDAKPQKKHSHIEPNVARLDASMANKRARRDALAAALAAQVGGARDLQREAAALVGRARHASGRLIVAYFIFLVGGWLGWFSADSLCVSQFHKQKI